jgi:predicted transposase/invertase (TIGR01784 family)
MPLFTKQEHELETHFDKWVYFLKNLENFDHIPSVLNEPIFQKGFEIAELAHLTPRQYDAYLKSLMEYSEVKNVSDASFGDGRIAEKREIAKNMLAKSFDLKTISELTGLSEAEIGNL